MRVFQIVAPTKPIGEITHVDTATVIEIALEVKHVTTTHAALNLLAPQKAEHAPGPALEVNVKFPVDATSIIDYPVASNSNVTYD